MTRIASCLSLACLCWITGCTTMLDRRDAPPPLTPSTMQTRRQSPVAPADVTAANAKAKLQQLQDEIDRDASLDQP
ncbi:MAG TPA: hypothetical protein PKD86_11055 [Gemmatales bacterium]|nr:hypothetical protein [Gemmatales bacterium]HMP59883.1 hypothetical protein [Gemmatales bacterium]